ncbi:MAG: hypothetical protein DELT_01529 [Desulfovibrio sp.]
MKAVDGLVVLSPQLAETVRDVFGYKGPVSIEPSAFSPEIFKPAPFSWPEKGETLHLVYLGRFHKGKGVEELVAAMEYLPDNVHLRIIGGSPKDRYEALQRAASHIREGATRISFTGALPQREAATAVEGAHIFVIPQQGGELFFSPLKLYEALALGVPVLATPLDTFAAQREAGLIATAPGTEPRELAEGIMHLAANKEHAFALREKGLAAARSATWQSRAERILEFCRNLP